ncbi:MAG TPA: DUF1028 domain-containing protein [Pseudolabrys sp.]|jgi:uncharacterized Ntn-hydrolase superfamily protein|nr:DUF1028 domain-containing protein [Pseudolabrys sp.]
MTWSIIARDKASGAFGIAVATRFFAVGARVPFIAAGIGAVATQALVNPFYGTDGLALLRDGRSADDVVAMLIAADAGRDYRQVHVMDAAGRVAAHTGTACIDWCGHLAGDGFSVAGNMLAGKAVIEDTAAAYLANIAAPFPQRLIAAMHAGEAAGGDKRGKQSAALLIHGEEAWSDLDLRVDDHPDPLAELDRLEQMSRTHWMVFRRFLPSHRDRVGVTDRGVIEAAILEAQRAASQS